MTELEAVPGIGPAIAKKLEAAFITTAELLAVQNPDELNARTNIGPGKAVSIVRAARKVIGKFEFRSGLEVERELELKPRLSTGVSKLDKHLWGGIELGSIVELFGKARAGKTQWCAMLAIMVQLPLKDGGLEGRVLWLDTERAFKPWIIRAMAYRRGLDPEVALGNIGHATIIDSSQIQERFENIPNLLARENYKLVIIDSFTGLFRSEYTGLDSLRIRQQKMNKLLSLMRRTAAATEAIFVYTNQVMSKISQFSSSLNAPSGGHILSHASDYRFNLKVGKDDQRKIALQDNAGVPEFELTLKLGWGGFYENAKEKDNMQDAILKYLRSRGCDHQAVLKEIEQEAVA